MSRKTYARQSLASQVVNKIVEDEHIKLFVDQYNTPYIAPNGDGTAVYDLDSQEASDWLSYYTMDNFNNAVLLRDEPKTVIDTLRGYAKGRNRGRHVQLELRTCMNEDAVWYDLGSGAIKVSPNKWEFVPQPPILFVRNSTQQEQVLPECGGNIWEIFEYVNIENPQDRLLLISFLVASLVPNANKPILALSGPAGCGKSECTRALKALMDPTVPTSLPPITKTDELNKLALTSSVMTFDNLSVMKNSVADQFCRLATGAGVRIRKLYKTNEYITFEAIRPIIINGVSQIITQSDLLTRTIPVELSPLVKRMTDDELHEKFATARPRLLGAMFDLLSKAMAIYPKITRNEWPRMGAFAKWGYAVCEALGGESSGEAFMEAYSKVEEAQHREALYANPLAEVIEWVMAKMDVWMGTAGDLLDLALKATEAKTAPKGFRYLCRSPYWPSNPRSTSVCLRKNVNDFSSVGLIVIPPKSTERHFFIVNKKLPCCRACIQVLNKKSPDGPTFAELGYDAKDLIESSIYTIDHRLVRFDETGEPCLNTYDNKALLIFGVKEGLCELKDIDDNIVNATHSWLSCSIVYGELLRKTEKRLEIERKRRERFERRQELERIRARELAEKERRKQMSWQKQIEKKQADYIAECREKGVPINKEELDFFGCPF